MINRKLKKKLIAASLAVGALTFVPAICSVSTNDSLIIISTAHAEVKTYIGVGEYIMQNDQTPDFAIQNAQIYAERNALEQAGIFVSSQTVVQNARLKRDEIQTFTAGILKVTVDKVEPIPLTGEGAGYIKYRVTIRAEIDTDDLNNRVSQWLNRGEQERSDLVNQNNELQQTVDNIQQRIVTLEQNINNAGTNKRQINAEIASIGNESLYARKLEEGNKSYYQGNYNNAVERYSEAIQINPNSDKSYYNRGRAYYYLQDYNAAIADYTKAIKIDSQNASAYYNRGYVYTELQKYKEAVADYTKVIELHSDFAGAYYNRGVSYGKLKKYNEAINDYIKAIQLNSNYAKSYNNREFVYALSSNFDQAIKDCNQIIERNPNLAAAYYVRGLIYQKLSDNARAEADFAKARQLGYNG